MIGLKQGDYEEAIRCLCRVREYGIPDQLKFDIINELKKLSPFGWKNVDFVTEKLVSLGKRSLNENIWHCVFSAVKDRVEYLRNQNNTNAVNGEEVPREQQARECIGLNEAIMTEVSAWSHYSPPLKYKGEAVINRSEYYRMYEDGLDGWNSKGRPPMQNCIMDDYMAKYSDALTMEEKTGDYNILKNTIIEFYKNLVEIRTAQVSIRQKGLLEKLRLEKVAQSGNEVAV